MKSFWFTGTYRVLYNAATLTFFLCFSTSLCRAQKNMAGEYETNFPSYGMFSKTLRLNCDGTAVLNFRGDLMNDNSNGSWIVKNDTLILNFDAAASSTKQRFTGIMRFQIVRKRLYRVTEVTRDEYNALRDKMLKDSVRAKKKKKMLLMRLLKKCQTHRLKTTRAIREYNTFNPKSNMPAQINKTVPPQKKR